MATIKGVSSKAFNITQVSSNNLATQQALATFMHELFAALQGSLRPFVFNYDA
jgi:hypothetical protein